MKEFKNKQQFIITFDEIVKEKLLNQNFTLISSNNGNFIFINDGIMTFDSDEYKDILSKIAYTNVLCI